MTGANSLRRLVDQLDVQSQRHDHLGLKSARKSTLTDANQKRPITAFYGLFFQLLSKLAKQKGLAEVAGQVQLIGLTTITLNPSQYQWADYRKNKSDLKVNVLYDPNAQTSIYFEITHARVSDSQAIKQLTVFKDVTYAFDRAYNGGQCLEKLVNKGCIFVGRMKKGMRYEVIQTNPPEGKGVVKDQQIRVIYKTRQWLKDETLRRIQYHRESDGKELVFFTNDLNRSALEIANLYKQRWQIELFFKWIKQNLKIKRFYGTSDAASDPASSGTEFIR